MDLIGVDNLYFSKPNKILNTARAELFEYSMESFDDNYLHSPGLQLDSIWAAILKHAFLEEDWDDRKQCFAIYTSI